MENGSNQEMNLQLLFEKYLNNTCSNKELEMIIEAAKEESGELYEVLKAQWNTATIDQVYKEDRWNLLFDSMMEKAKEMELINGTETFSAPEPQPVTINKRRSRQYFRIAAAAALLIALSTTIFFLFRSDDKELSQENNIMQGAQDVTPGGDKAILTLADGTKIILDSADNGTLARQGGITVIKIGGQLSYNPEGNSKQVFYNTIATPKGGQYQLELADGSKVWLNAASSLRFPTAFLGNERTVELTGEGYFEVAHNPNMPFHVKITPASPSGSDMDVKVLGTHFNINAYSDESSLRTTLIEGSVLVSAKKLNRAIVLKPGQQSVLDPATLSMNKNVDTEEIIAWKNGQFIFNSTSLTEIMSQIARWYDVEVEYNGVIDDRKFSGIVSRKSNLSEVLVIMKQAGVKFQVQDKKIKVLQ